MRDQNSLDKPTTKQSVGVLIAIGCALIGGIASVVIRENDGPPLLAFLLMAFFNLAGAVLLDAANRNKGRVTGAMLILLALIALPLLWVEDRSAYLRANPLTFGAMVLIAGYLPNLNKRRWALYLLAFILGLFHIVISLNQIYYTYI